MPIYEYECRDCGERFEHLLRAGEPPVCPACGSQNLEKQISAPSAPQMARRWLVVGEVPFFQPLV